MEEPRSGVGPPAFCGGFRDAKNFRRFIDLHPDEIAKFHQFSLARLQFREAVKGIVERKKLIIGRRAGDFEFIHVEMERARAPALGVFPSGAADQNAAHGFSGGAEEVRPILPRLVP